MPDNLIIIKNGNSYTLPDEWAISDSGSYDFNNKLADKSFAHGANLIGDGKANGRTITIEFATKESSEVLHDAAVNTAYQWFNGEFTLIAGRTDRVYKVAGVSKIKHKFEKGFKQRWSNVTVSLLLADPFRYASESVAIVTEFAEPQDNAEITFANYSSVDTPLIFELTPAAGADLPFVKILHVESGQTFTMADTVLVGKTAIINGELGTVSRGIDNSINTFSGVFIHAMPGANTLKYSGKACTLKVTYAPRWFV